MKVLQAEFATTQLERCGQREVYQIEQHVRNSARRLPQRAGNFVLRLCH
ncbi:MAG: hypothetical protein WC184_12215 [Acidimicrobiia bacterium]